MISAAYSMNPDFREKLDVIFPKKNYKISVSLIVRDAHDALC